MEEYHNPIGKTDYLSIQHIERYRFAISRLRPGMQVLDIASGVGYGTAMLSEFGCKVVGVDYNDELLEVAQRLWKHKNFIKANALNLPFDDENFDAIVSFETIEHVEDGFKFLSEMHRILRVGGILLCSTPNIKYTSHPPYHLKEYEPEEFFEMIGQVFSHVEKYGQYYKPIDRIRDLYQWYILNRFVSLIERLGIKELVKRLFSFNSMTSVDLVRENLINARFNLKQLLNEDENRDYRVREYTDSKWLRIMIVVARKEAM